MLKWLVGGGWVEPIPIPMEKVKKNPPNEGGDGGDCVAPGFLGRIRGIFSFNRFLKGPKEVPEPPSSFKSVVGPGAILAAMAIGAGELILWPVLVTKHGYGLLWLIPIALIVQFFWLTESTRWTIATGESWIQATGRIPGRGLWVGLWLAIMTISLIWPGWAVASAAALWAFTGGHASPISLRWWGVICYLIAVAALVFPRSVYSGLFLASAASLVLFNVGLVIATVVVAVHNPHTLIEALKGMVSFGHIPSGVDMKLLASAIAWAGLGAMGNAFYSLLVRDRGWGMAKYIGRIPGILGKPTTISEVGYKPGLEDPVDIKRLRVWSRILEKDCLLIFFVPSLLSLFMFAYLAGALLHPLYVAGKITAAQLRGIEAVVMQSRFFEVFVGHGGVVVYAIVAVLVLWSTQIGLLDAMARTWADTLSVYSERVRKAGIRRAYMAFLALFTIVGLTIILSGAFQARPVELLKIGAILGISQQIISIPVTLVVNHKLMPPEMRRSVGVRGVFSGVLAMGVLLYALALLAAL